MDRFVALSNLALPVAHDERDVALARSLLEDHLAGSLEEGDTGEAIRTIANLLANDLASTERGEELLTEGDELMQIADEQGRMRFVLAAEHFCRGQFITARDAGRAEDAEGWLQRARHYSGVDEESGPDEESLDLAQLAALASQYHMSGDAEHAADTYRRIVDATGLGDYAPVQEFALNEGVLRLQLGDFERAAEATTALLPFVEARYLTAVVDDDVSDAEQRLTDTVEVLAQAEAACGRWDEVVRTLDRSTGLRLRYRAALREQGDAESIIALERELDAATRGAETDEEDGVSARARLLEEYRRVRAALPADRMESPAIGELADVLEPDEALATIATTSACTLVAVVTSSHDGGSASGAIDFDWSWDEWLVRLARDGDNGWVSALLDPDPAEPEEALAWILAELDEGPIRQIRELLPAAVRRLTLIPHDVLNLIPWWAASGLEDLQVAIGPSVTEVVRVRRADAEPGGRTALIVANPTHDLAATGLGCAAAAERLGDARFDVELMSGDEATEPYFLDALKGRSVLHFAGHGRLERRRSALELNAGPLPEPDPFPAWVQSVAEWREVAREDDEDADEDEAGANGDERSSPSERWADLEGVGRLYERRIQGGPLERVLERRDGTLAATYAGESLIRISELWSGTDIVVGDAIRGCRLAVLCACQSGAGAGRGDEAPGFPAAFALAGVDTVIGSLWRVEEPFAALWVELFYEALAGSLEAGPEAVDVAGLVQDVGGRVRTMDRETARGRLFDLAERTDDPLVRLELEAYAESIGEPPFADAWRWGAFYVAGCPTVRFNPAEP
jgi:CHAT domain